MSNHCDIEITIDLQDDIAVLATCDCEVDVLIDLDTDVEILAFDWPPIIDRFQADLAAVENRVKELEESPPTPTIVVDDEVTEQGTNPVSSRGLFAFFAGLLDDLQEWITSNFASTNDARLSDAREPLSHIHQKSDITGLEKVLDSVVVDITITTPTEILDIQSDKNGEPFNFIDGDRFSVIFEGTLQLENGDPVAARMGWRCNNFSTARYYVATSSTSIFMGIIAANVYWNCLFDMAVINGELVGTVMRKYGNSSTDFSGGSTVGAHSLNSNGQIVPVNSIQLVAALNNSLLAPGTRIIIIKK